MEQAAIAVGAPPTVQDIAQAPRGVWTFGGDGHLVDVGKPPAVNSPFKLLLQLAGRSEISQRGKRLSLVSRQFVLIDGAQPFSVAIKGRFEQVLVTIPRSTIFGCGAHVQRAIASAFGEETGAEAMTRDFVLSLARQASCLPEATLARSIVALANLLTELGTARATNIGSALHHRAIALIDLELSDINAERLAAMLGVSRRYLDRLFAVSGNTVHQHIWERRLQTAAERLRRSRRETITEIAYSVGFNDASHFSRLFRQRFGIAPRQFRAQES